MSFNTKIVSKLIGLTLRQIDYWDRTHFIKPSIREASGYGSVRLYSFPDLVSLKVAKTLKDQGLSLQKIRKSINYLKKNFPDIKRPLAELKFVTDGKSIFILTKNKNMVLDTLSKGQLVMTVVALGQIIEELKDNVEKISQDRKYKVKVMGKNYEVILHPDLESGGFWIECPSIRGCASQGDTVEEALDMIKEAIELCLEVMAEEKKKIKRAVA